MFCDNSELVRVPDEIRDCVCFISAQRSTGPNELGSAFFIGVEIGFEDRVFVYVVTAKHCIVSKKAGLADLVALRVNTQTGESEEIRTNPTQWLLHPTSDVAVLPIGALDGAVYKYRVYPVNSAATTEFILARNVGPGDDVFVTGLLVHHPGTIRIMPVVRLGSIAALPEDSVTLTTGDDIVALLEVRSIGGISGSPVFVHLPFWRDTAKGDLFVGVGGTAGSGGEHRLLGVIHGFYPVGANDPDGVSRGKEDLNTGIAVVVLVDRILDVINQPPQMEMRDKVRKALERDQIPNPRALT